MRYSTPALAALGFAAISSAHMIMTTPVPYGKSTLNNSPLAADGSDYPCKLRGTTFDMEDASNVMAIGSTQSLAFQGSAVHGGGSCQVSIAMLPSGATLSTLSDSEASSLSFKVIHSIQGGCPQQNIAGNNGDSATQVDPDTYNFTIPDAVPAGNATLAWTWFNKIGNREMYMNCAPVTITSSTSKRDSLESRDTSAFSALPDLFTANIGNGCTTQDSTDLIFPDPGDSFENLGIATSTAAASATGSCQAAVAATGTATSAAVGAATPTVATSAVATSAVATSAVATSAVATSAAASPASAGAESTFTSDGGVFITTPPQPTISAAASITATASAIPIAASTVSAAASSASSVSTTGAFAAGTACTTPGMFNCVAGSSYQQCASGTWSVVQSLAAGTQCTVGQSMSINVTSTTKRGLKKWPREHIRRHLQGSA